MPTCYLMVGVPGSGKSTYIKEVKKENPNLISVSSDEYLEEIAQKEGKSYSDVHKEHIKSATKWLNNRIASLISNKEDFIWDQTNLNPKSRKDKIQPLLKKGYDVCAITFELSAEEVKKRVKERGEATGKFIPRSIMESMISNYVRPSYEEGFKSIYVANGFGDSYLLTKNTTTNKP